MDAWGILSTLTGARGPSGHEGAVIAAAEELLAPLCHTTHSDCMGNIFGVVHSAAGDAKTVLLEAHLDEIGVLITGREKNFYTFKNIGGIDRRVWAGLELEILTSPSIPAVVACLPPHVSKGEDEYSELYIDAGGMDIPIGTPGVFARGLFRSGNCASAPGLDNRAGFCALVLMLDMLDKSLLPVNIIVCGSVQEEIGGRGAAALAYEIMPDWAVAVDVTYGACPYSGQDTFPLGKGACINRGPDCNRELTNSLINLAQREAIPYQIEVTCGLSRTSATYMQTVASGIPTAVLSVPLRYMHTPTEMLCLDDIGTAANLLKAWVMSL
ncbi:MAG: M20/M25/M40 family metallo-hydrolase [Oscillospiraceae bacterium]|nr:M20/M25/M40 family metallo-hydrolase [Oscillospiraceae bacterium]